MDDALRRMILEDMAQLREGDVYNMLSIAKHIDRLLGFYDDANSRSLQAKRIMGAMSDGYDAWRNGCRYDDAAFSTAAHAKAFLEENS